MLGLSPKSRKDLLTAADILREYSETILDPLNSPYDRMQQEQFSKLLKEFEKVIKDTTVEIVEKNVSEVMASPESTKPIEQI